MKHRYDILIVSGAALAVVIAAALIQYYFFHPPRPQEVEQRIEIAMEAMENNRAVADYGIQTHSNHPPDLHRLLRDLVSVGKYGGCYPDEMAIDRDVLAQLPQHGASALAEYVGALRARDPETRAGAAYMISVVGTTEPAVLDLLVENTICATHYLERAHSNEALFKLDVRLAEELMHWQAGELDYDYTHFLLRERRDRAYAWRDSLLERWGTPLQRGAVIDELVKAARGADRARQNLALDALNGLGPGAESAITRLTAHVNKLEKQDYQLSQALAGILGRIGPVAVPALVDLLDRRPEGKSAECALEALKMMPAEALEPAINVAVYYALHADYTTQSRRYADDIIGLVGDRAADAIKPLLASQDPAALEPALNLVSAAASQPSDPDEYHDTGRLNQLIPRLRELCHHPQVDVMTTAFFTIAELRPLPGDLALEILLLIDEETKAHNPEIYWITSCGTIAVSKMRPVPPEAIAIYVNQTEVHYDSPDQVLYYIGDFVTLGTQAGPALPRLRELEAGHPDAKVREAAAKAIESIEAKVYR